MNIRPLTRDEIEVRIGVCKENGVSLLLYKDARVDRAILDEVVGSDNWQNKFYECNGTMICSVGVRVARRDWEGEPEWVWKDDAGSPSNMEAAKGEASDAFKRACFKWGIGIELYTSPFIWVPSDRCTIRQGKNGRPVCYDRFSVEKIVTVDGRIEKVSIWNDTLGKRAFVFVGQGEDQ